jgi:hypothetical protein
VQQDQRRATVGRPVVVDGQPAKTPNGGADGSNDLHLVLLE